MRRFPNRDRVEMGSKRKASDHTGGPAIYSNPVRERWAEPTPPQLMNFSIDDCTVVSYTTDSFTFTSAHPFFPGWVRVVQGTPCSHNPEEELQAKKRVRRDVEPPKVRRFLQRELLRKVGHSW